MNIVIAWPWFGIFDLIAVLRAHGEGGRVFIDGVIVSVVVSGAGGQGLAQGVYFWFGTYCYSGS